MISKNPRLHLRLLSILLRFLLLLLYSHPRQCRRRYRVNFTHSSNENTLTELMRMSLQLSQGTLCPNLSQLNPKLNNFNANSSTIGKRKKGAYKVWQDVGLCTLTLSDGTDVVLKTPVGTLHSQHLHSQYNRHNQRNHHQISQHLRS